MEMQDFMSSPLGFAGEIVGVGAGIMLLVFAVFFFLLSRFYVRPKQGQALIRNGVGGTRVAFAGLLCYPLIHRLETIDLTLKRLTVEFRDAGSLTTRDGIQVEVVAAFLLRIDPSPDDILKVADDIGAKKAADPEFLESLFLPRFSDSLKTAVQAADFQFIETERERFRAELRKRIGEDLSGFTLDSIALDHFGKRDWTAD